MSFKRKSPPEAPQLPPPPPIPELMDIIDEVAGVQTITVVGPDGKKRRHTQRLPLTPQEQQTLSQAETLINSAVNNIQKLYEYDPNSVINYQPFIQAFSNINNERMQDLAQIGNFKDIAEKVEQFRNINRDLSVREFDNRERMLEENLARRGLSRSTEATELRAAMAKERGLLEQQLDVNAQNYGEDLNSRRLKREADIFELRESGRQARLQEAEAGYNLGRQKKEDAEALRQNAINENLNLLNVGQSVKGADTERARFGLAHGQNAISLLGTQANNSMQNYNARLNQITGQHTMNMNQYRETPASFGSQIRDLGLAAAGAYIGGGVSGLSGGIGPAQAGYNLGSKIRGFGG